MESRQHAEIASLKIIVQVITSDPQRPLSSPLSQGHAEPLAGICGLGVLFVPRRFVVIQVIGFVGKNYRKIQFFMGRSNFSWENPIVHGKIDGFRFRCSLTSTHFLLWINIEDPKDREWSKVSHVGKPKNVMKSIKHVINMS